MVLFAYEGEPWQLLTIQETIVLSVSTSQGRIQDLGKGGSIGIRTRAKRARNFEHTHFGLDHAYF